MSFSKIQLVAESLRIEGIHRRPTLGELAEFDRFMALDTVTVQDLIQFVLAYEPGAVLRDRPGSDVIIGGRRPVLGGPDVTTQLDDLLKSINKSVDDGVGRSYSYLAHIRYEILHPFSDCNGRSGRMLWFWMMRDMPLGFLHQWYYFSLAHASKNGWF